MGALAIIVATAAGVALWLIRKGHNSRIANGESDLKPVGEIPSKEALSVGPELEAGDDDLNVPGDPNTVGAETLESAASTKGQTDLSEEAGLNGYTMPEDAHSTHPRDVQPATLQPANVDRASELNLPTSSGVLTTKTTEEENRAERLPLDPVKRGGRPRDSKPTQRPTAQITRQQKVRAEIVCWKRMREWVVGVELAEPIVPQSGVQVLQNGQALNVDEHKGRCWPLEQLHGDIVVTGSVQTHNSIGIVLKEDFLLFKLSGRDLNDGRRVRTASFGSYLVIAPTSWERDEVLSGKARVSPEHVSHEGYLAHFFTLEHDDATIAFKNKTGAFTRFESRGTRLELVGNRINDFSENMGPLFGGLPPQIRAADTTVWDGIETIVVGAEGSDRDQWRMSVTPKRGELSQTLPGNVAGRNGGWYFLRFYDRNDDLLESMDFRFIRGLRELQINESGPFPSKTGHQAAAIVFRHENGWTVTPAGSSSRSLEIEKEDQLTAITIPAKPAFDHTYWNMILPRFDELRPDLNMPPSVKVELRILVERIWWSRGDVSDREIVWFDTPISVERRDFAATSTYTIEIRFPNAGWTDEVCIGFDQLTKQRYPVLNDATKVSIPLRNFGEAAAVANRNEAASLKLWIPRIRDGGIVICELAPYLTQAPIAPAGPPVQEANPSNRKSCLTCDHARINSHYLQGTRVRVLRHLVICRLREWQDTDNKSELKSYFESTQGHNGYCCGRWYGEYYDSSGKYHTT